MAMVCPQCNEVFEQGEQVCPTCSIHLLYYAPVAASAQANAALDSDTEGALLQSMWGRVLAAFVVSQGLALGLKQLLTAGLLASGEEVSETLGTTVTGLVVLHSLHVIGLLIGGALAGAGQERGTLYGALAGLGSGFLFMFLNPQMERILPTLAVFGQPLVHLVFGALGGLIGSTIWHPTPRFAMPSGKQSEPPAPMFEMRWLHGPIAWPRLIAGATIMACGSLWSNWIMKWLIEASQGSLSVTTHFQARLVSWEIAGLTMFLGACLAGATTWNATKQGLCVGIGGAILYVGYQLANPNAQLEVAMITVLCMIALGLAGGWFGGQMFPPLARSGRRRRIADA